MVGILVLFFPLFDVKFQFFLKFSWIIMKSLWASGVRFETRWILLRPLRFSIPGFCLRQDSNPDVPLTHITYCTLTSRPKPLRHSILSLFFWEKDCSQSWLLKRIFFRVDWYNQNAVCYNNLDSFVSSCSYQWQWTPKTELYESALSLCVRILTDWDNRRDESIIILFINNFVESFCCLSWS